MNIEALIQEGFDYTKYKNIINNAAAKYGFDIAEYFSAEYKAHRKDDPDFLKHLDVCMFTLGKAFRYYGKIAEDDLPNLKRLTAERYMVLEKQYLKFCHQVHEDLRIKQEIFEEINNQETAAVLPPETPNIDASILLLEALGIIDLLRAKIRNKKDIAAALEIITGQKWSAESFRKKERLLGNVQSEDKETPYKKEAIEKVISILQLLKVPSQSLDVIYAKLINK
jgi:hypothetical protein